MLSRQKFNFNPAMAAASTPQNEPSTAGVPERMQQLDRLDDNIKEPFQIRYIHRNHIRKNRKNHYPQSKSDIEKMQRSILEFGLQQNLTAAYITEEDMYVLESGHTRTAALDALIAKYEEYPDPDDADYKLYLQNVHVYHEKGYPCRITGIISDSVDYDSEADLADIPEEVIDSEIRLILTNEVSRSRTPAVIAENIARLDALYKRKNMDSRGRNRINVNQTIAKDLGLSERHVKNYKAVTNKLVPELQEEFEKNNITLKEAANYSKLPDSEQKTVLSMLNSGKKVSAEEAAFLKKDVTEDETDPKEKEVIALSPAQAALTKSELSLRAAFETCKRELRKYMELQEEYKILRLRHKDEPDISGIGILSDADLQSFAATLKELLSEEQSHEYA